MHHAMANNKRHTHKTMTQKHIKTAVDIAAHIVTAAALIYIVYIYPPMPDIIPTHYGISGRADTFGDKSAVWTPFSLLAIFHIGLGIINRFPQIFNYPIKIKDIHRDEIYLTAQHMLSWIRLLIDIIFAAVLTSAAHAATTLLWPLLLALIGFHAMLICFTLKMKRINDRQ